MIAERPRADVALKPRRVPARSRVPADMYDQDPKGHTGAKCRAAFPQNKRGAFVGRPAQRSSDGSRLQRLLQRAWEDVASRMAAAVRFEKSRLK